MHSFILAAGFEDLIIGWLGVAVGVGVLLIGLAVGFRDILRFSGRRVWAIATVCSQQAIRRRVLWLTPLVFLGVIIVSSLANPADELDDIRQTVRFSLFATGMVLTLVIIILAATNLPKEIDSRVIYTVATKPTTRLEIIVGKVLGFARISAAILLLMGIFTAGYLKYREWRLLSHVDTALASDVPLDAPRRAALRYYQQAGLLHARVIEAPGRVQASAWDQAMGAAPKFRPTALQIYSRSPMDGGPWMGGGDQGNIIQVPFAVPRELIPAGDSTPPDAMHVRMRLTSRLAPSATTMPSTAPVSPPPPAISFTLKTIFGGVLADSEGMGLANGIPFENGKWLDVPLPAELFQGLLRSPVAKYVLVLEVRGFHEAMEYSAGREDFELRPRIRDVPIPPSDEIAYSGKSGTYGQQLKPAGKSAGPVGVYSFRNVAIDTSRKTLPFEMTVSIERSGSDVEEEEEAAVDLTVRNIDTGKSASQVVHPESRRGTFFEVPSELLKGGNFDVTLKSRGHWLGLKIGQNASIRLVAGSDSFAWNLVKSLLVLWLLSVLVAIVAVFCSTFVSWPIAVVMTLMILLSRWGFEQLDIESGMARQIAGDVFGARSAGQTEVVAGSVELLTTLLKAASAVLPDISQFASTESIAAGMAMPLSTLLGSLRVALVFGVPMILLSYVFLKNKEVAP